jgi:hypothetical protein
MQQCLPLYASALEISLYTMLLNLRDVSLHQTPSPDLPRIFFGQTSTHKITAVPLKPASRIFIINPTIFPPHGEGLACVYFKKI